VKASPRDRQNVLETERLLSFLKRSGRPGAEAAIDERKDDEPPSGVDRQRDPTR
jgi:hypothetical protein